MGVSFATHVFLLLWFFAATFSLSFFKVESSVSCNEKEKQALLSLKSAFTDPENLLSSWSNGEDCCTWYGVRCDNITGRVIELHLSYLKLAGEISPSLLKLEFLNYLDLSLNNFNHYPIPRFLGLMGSLRHLDLHNAGFYGLIPLQLGNLSHLRHLDLGRNFVLSVENLLWMSPLSSLQYLDLSHTYLSKEVDWLQIMNKFPSLRELYLGSCGLNCMNPILGSVNFTSLQVFDLSENHFSHQIPNWFFNLSSSLLMLNLADSVLKGKIPSSILNSQNLEILLLQSNQLTGKIPESLGNLKHLKYLNLEYNFLSGPIPFSIGNLSYLQTLCLGENQFNGTIPKSFGHLSNLVYLSISYNHLTGPLNEAHFSKLAKLKFLYMSQNPLFFNVNSNWVPPFQLEYAFMSSCKIGPNFPIWLQTQRSLKNLQISMSGISGKAPSWFWNLTSSIDSIDLSGNQMEGDVSNILLNSTVLNLRSNHFKGRMLRLSTNVKELNIANNSFSGPIITFLCRKMNRKNKLMILSASNNFLSGELPHCLRYWLTLTHLDLGSNKLFGRIPYSMGYLVALKFLNLQNNNISGVIPSSMGSLVALKFLNLQNNNISGVIPSSMGSLVALRFLYLKNNSIFGVIPSLLKKCSQIEVIDIGDNYLKDTIPLWIGDMTHLRVLALRSNGFMGHIPTQICQLSSLKILDLANNNLSGPIPKCLNNINALSTVHTRDFTYLDDERGFEYEENFLLYMGIIDLSSNNLSGSIPTEISILSKLIILNLSRNHLTGMIPEEIGSMEDLEAVDLSRNHLYGEIPSSMSNLTFLAWLDLSYNNLSGRIPSGNQLQYFGALSYTNNPQLCDVPLQKNCTVEEGYLDRTSIGKIDDSENFNFYMGMGVGFAIGFWTVCGILFFNRTWRHAYFKFFDGINDWLYVITMLKVNWLLEKLQ